MSQVTVRVRCVMDIPVGLWNSNCTLDELRDIAKREGLQKLQSMAKALGGTVYGIPKPVFVMVEDE